MKHVRNKGLCSLRHAFYIVCALRVCAEEKDLAKGSKLHAYVQKHNFLAKNRYISNALVSMYARCSALAKAQQLLNQLPIRNVVTWNALIAGYAQQGHGSEALKCFDSMQHEGHLPNAITFTCALKACGSIGAVSKGEMIHDKIVNLGLLEKDTLLGSTLVDMYVRCGLLSKAQQVFNELPIRDVFMWTALIAGYAQQGQGEAALKYFHSMQGEGHSADAVTFICALKACGSLGALNKGEEIHEKIISLDMLENDIVLGGALVDMYAKCGAFAEAQKVLNELPVRDVVTWNALITGYIQQGKSEEALQCFDNMQHEGHTPVSVTCTCALQACGSIGAATKGENVHDKIVHFGMLENNTVLGSALVVMYAKCGALMEAVEVLEELPVQDAVLWNSLIGGYAQQGLATEALHCFERMQFKRVRPDTTTLVCIFNACSHSGLVDEAEMLFSRINTYVIIPDLEHYCCMVDLFGRAGKFSKALIMIEKMPSAEYPLVWHALLGACHKWRDTKVGKFAFECALELDINAAAAYVCISNIFTATKKILIPRK